MCSCESITHVASGQAVQPSDQGAGRLMQQLACSFRNQSSKSVCASAHQRFWVATLCPTICSLLNWELLFGFSHAACSLWWGTKCICIWYLLAQTCNWGLHFCCCCLRGNIYMKKKRCRIEAANPLYFLLSIQISVCVWCLQPRLESLCASRGETKKCIACLDLACAPLWGQN